MPNRHAISSIEPQTTNPAQASSSVTAVVVAHDDAALIGRCLANLGAHPAIVVDNGCRDSTIAITRDVRSDAQVVRCERNLGYSAAVNRGVAEVQTRYGVVVHPDATTGRDTLDTLAAFLDQHPSAGAVAPRLLNPDGSVQHSARTFPTAMSMLARRTPLGRTSPGRRVLEHHVASSESDHATTIDWAIDAVLAFRVEAFRAAGGFDEQFFLHAQDVDFCARLWAAGWEVWYTPTATAVHRYPRESRKTLALRTPAVREHWSSIAKLTKKYPRQMVLGWRRPAAVGESIVDLRRPTSTRVTTTGEQA